MAAPTAPISRRVNLGQPGKTKPNPRIKLHGWVDSRAPERSSAVSRGLHGDLDQEPSRVKTDSSPCSARAGFGASTVCRAGVFICRGDVSSPTAPRMKYHRLRLSRVSSRAVPGELRPVSPPESGCTFALSPPHQREFCFAFQRGCFLTRSVLPGSRTCM